MFAASLCIAADMLLKASSYDKRATSVAARSRMKTVAGSHGLQSAGVGAVALCARDLDPVGLCCW